MTKDEYYSLKKGDIVTWLDTGGKCLVMHFDTTDYPKDKRTLRQNPNKEQILCAIFIDDNFRVIGHRKEFGHINRKNFE